MKTITIQISDKTAKALDKLTQAYLFYKHPKEQVYSAIIEELVQDANRIQLFKKVFKRMSVKEEKQ